MSAARTLGPVGDGSEHFADEGRVVTLHPDRTDANSMLQDLIVGKQGRCVYCGWPSWGFTCSAHRDLLRLDPTFLV